MQRNTSVLLNHANLSRDASFVFFLFFFSPPLRLENVCVCFEIRACLLQMQSVPNPDAKTSAFMMWFYLWPSTLAFPLCSRWPCDSALLPCQQRRPPLPHIKQKKKKKKKTEHGTGLEQCDPDAVPAGSRIQTSPPSWSRLTSPLVPPLQSSCLSSLSSCSSILSSNPACHRPPRLYLPFFLDCAPAPSPSPSLVYLWLCSHGDGHGCHSDRVTTRTASSEKGETRDSQWNAAIVPKRLSLSLSLGETHTHTHTHTQHVQMPRG